MINAYSKLEEEWRNRLPPRKVVAGYRPAHNGDSSKNPSLLQQFFFY